MQRTACEENHPGTLFPCDGWLLAPVKAGPGYTDFIALAADTKSLSSINGTEIGAESAR